MSDTTAAAVAASHEAHYERERAAAEDDGTAILELTDDAPPADLYHAAKELADLIGPESLADLRDTIGVADVDPARWESLDVSRAAGYARSFDPDGFSRLVLTYPWLEDAAGRSHHDALGTLADRFVDHG